MAYIDCPEVIVNWSSPPGKELTSQQKQCHRAFTVFKYLQPIEETIYNGWLSEHTNINWEIKDVLLFTVPDRESCITVFWKLLCEPNKKLPSKHSDLIHICNRTGSLWILNLKTVVWKIVPFEDKQNSGQWEANIGIIEVCRYKMGGRKYIPK